MNPSYYSIGGWSLLLLAPFTALLVYRITASHGHTVFPYSTILVFVFMAGICLWVPCHSSEPFSVLGNIVESSRKALRLFTMSEPVESFLTYVGKLSFPSALSMHSFKALGIFLFALCPCLTVGFLLSCFRSITARFRVYCHHNRDKYVFSQLNDASLALAGSIKKRFPKAVLIFTAVADSEQNTAHALSQKACAIDAILLKEGITEIRWKRYQGKSVTHLFTIGDQDTNLYQASDLVKQYADCKDFRLYVFARGVESEALFNASSANGMRIRRIDPVHTVINHALYEKGDEIFREAVQISAREKLISIVVVGMGYCGSELIKTLTWFCQMTGYKLQIHAFDQNPDAESMFRRMCPDLMSPLHNGTSVPGDAQYEICIHAGCNVRTAEFYEELQKIGLITRIYVVLGDDTLNINTAIDIRTELARHCALSVPEEAQLPEDSEGVYYVSPAPHVNTAPPPTILAEVESTQKKESLQNMRKYHNNRYDLRFVGDNNTVYSCDIILDSKLEQDALQRHMRWAEDRSDDRSFWSDELNYQSSVAAAIHARMRILCRIPGADRRPQDLSKDEREKIEELEHRRWNAYMRGCGYCYSGSLNKTSRNDLAKLHNTLVPYWDLPGIIRENDSKVGLNDEPLPEKDKE